MVFLIYALVHQTHLALCFTQETILFLHGIHRGTHLPMSWPLCLIINLALSLHYTVWKTCVCVCVGGSINIPGLSLANSFHLGWSEGGSRWRPHPHTAQASLEWLGVWLSLLYGFNNHRQLLPLFVGSLRFWALLRPPLPLPWLFLTITNVHYPIASLAFSDLLITCN